ERRRATGRRRKPRGERRPLRRAYPSALPGEPRSPPPRPAKPLPSFGRAVRLLRHLDGSRGVRAHRVARARLTPRMTSVLELANPAGLWWLAILPLLLLPYLLRQRPRRRLIPALFLFAGAEPAKRAALGGRLRLRPL